MGASPRHRLPGLWLLAWGLLTVVLFVRTGPDWRGAFGHAVDSIGLFDPFRWSSFGTAVAGHGGAALGLVFVLATVRGVGRGPARWVGADDPGLSRELWRLVLGCGAMAGLVHGLGLAGLCAPALVRAVAVGLGVWGMAQVVRERPWRGWELPRGRERLPAWLAGAGLLALFVVARLPDTHEDPRVYHLAAPEAYLLAHKIYAVPRHVIWQMPRGAEMAFLPAWAVGGLAAAKLVAVATAVGLALAVAWMASTLVATEPTLAGWWAAALVLGAGQLLNLCWQPKNDLALALALTASLGAGLQVVRTRGRWLGAAAVAAGLAAGIKDTAGLFLLPMVLALGWACRGCRLRRGAAWAVLIGLGSCASWRLESWLQVGNPLHPYFANVFPDLHFKPEYVAVIRREQREWSPAVSRSPADLVGSLWRVVGGWDNGSPALFWLLPLAVLGVRSRARRFLLAGAAGPWVLWLATERVARYLLPALGVLGVLAVEPLIGILATGSRIRARVTGLAAAVAVLGPLALGTWSFLAPDGWAVLAGWVSVQTCRESRFTTWEGMRRWVNERTPADTRLLFSGEMRRLWFDRRVDSDMGNFASFPWLASRESRTPGELRKKYRQAGYTHLVHNFVSAQFRNLLWVPGEPWTARQLSLYAAFMGTYARPVYAPERYDHLNGGFWIAELTTRPGRPVANDYLPCTEGAFSQAWALEMAGKGHEAAAEARKVRASFPACGSADFMLGFLEADRGNGEEGWRLLAPWLSRGFKEDGLGSIAGDAAVMTGRQRDAVRAYGLSWRRFPEARVIDKLSGCWMTLGAAAAKAGRAKEALADFSQATALRPSDAAAHINVAAMESRLGDLPAALAELERALSLRRTDTDLAQQVDRLRARLAGQR